MIDPERFGRQPNPWDSPEELRFKRDMASVRRRGLILDAVFVVVVALTVCAVAGISWGLVG